MAGMLLRLYPYRVKNNSWNAVLNFLSFSVLSLVLAAVCAGVSSNAAVAQTATTSSATQQTPTATAALSNLALVPMPREVRQRALLLLYHGVGVSTPSRDAEDRFSVDDLVSGLKTRGVDAREGQRGQVKIILLRQETKKAKDILARANVIFDPAMHDEGYVLLTEGNKCYDIAATGAGLYYGAQTIKQLVLRGQPGLDSKPVLQGVLIRDWPAMKYRGMDDDLSRGPFPTLKFQEHQIKIFSEYKINIYSPYFENTLAYASNPLPAPPGGAMTRSDVEELVRYAQQYHVTIIPEQEAFGHLHHTLMYDTYSQLAETPHGAVLAPGQPGSIELIKQWFSEIAAMFPGPFIHIGADETVDLGRGQTKALVEQQGLGKVYMDFLIQIYNALQPLHKKILFWGDIAMNDPAEVKTLPKDMIAVAWVYSPQPEGYDKWLQPFIDAGLETWVAPGVSNWSRVYPDNNEALLNIQRFISDGQRLGSTGELNTAWNDDGEGLFNQDWYGVLFGAAAGWQPGSSSIPQFQNSFGQVFHGDTTGKINEAQIDLMAAQKTLEDTGLRYNSDRLFWVDPWSPEGQRISAKLLPIAHTLRLQAEQAIILMDQARSAGPLRETDALDAMEMGARRMDFIGFKFETAQQIADEYYGVYQAQNDPAAMRAAIHGMYTISGANGQCQDMRDGYGLTRDLYRQAWLKENRPYWLDNVSAQYDIAMQLWIQRGTRFSELMGEWHRTHMLPKPEDLGLPPMPPPPPPTAAPAPTS
jgi:hexosaminidase